MLACTREVPREYREAASLDDRAEREWAETVTRLGGDQYLDVLAKCSEAEVRASVLEARRIRRAMTDPEPPRERRGRRKT